MSKTNVVQEVSNYLTTQNRPYNVNDIFTNLHKEHGKTAVQKALDQLVQNGIIREKVYGKQKVYVANQDQCPSVSEAVLQEMDNEIKGLEEVMGKNLKENQLHEAKLKSLSTSLTMEQVINNTEMVSEENKTLQQKLELLNTNSVVISKENKDKIQSDYTKAVKEWKTRKRIAKTILDSILDGYPKSKQELFEDIGIEEENNTLQAK